MILTQKETDKRRGARQRGEKKQGVQLVRRTEAFEANSQGEIDKEDRGFVAEGAPFGGNAVSRYARGKVQYGNKWEQMAEFRRRYAA